MPSTSATTRLLITARNTGRGARRNWRQRTSTKPRRRTSGRSDARRRGAGGTAAASSPQDGERPPRRDRLGRVGGEQLDALGEPLELLLGVPEPDRDPDRVDRRQVADDRERARAPARATAAAAGQPAIRNVTRVAVVSRGVTSVTPSIAASRSARPAARRAARSMRPRQPDVHRQPAAAPREADDGRAVEEPVASNRRAPGRRTGRPPGRTSRTRCTRRWRGTTLSASARRTHSAPIPSGPRSHFWPGTA